MAKNNKGFTLIELLVVIAIIGILATIVLVSLNSARSKARDTQRVADLRQVQTALEMYYDSNGAGSYPATATVWTDLVSAKFLPSQPKDPGTGNPAYGYTACTSNTNYTLSATLENGGGALTTDVDGTTTCGVACGAADATDRTYCVQP